MNEAKKIIMKKRNNNFSKHKGRQRTTNKQTKKVRRNWTRTQEQRNSNEHYTYTWRAKNVESKWMHVCHFVELCFMPFLNVNIWCLLSTTLCVLCWLRVYMRSCKTLFFQIFNTVFSMEENCEIYELFKFQNWWKCIIITYHPSLRCEKVCVPIQKPQLSQIDLAN